MSKLRDLTSDEMIAEGIIPKIGTIEPKTEYIVIGFSVPKRPTIISRVVTYAEKTPFSHVYVKARSNSLERTMIYHASHDNLHFMNYDTFEADNSIYEEFCFRVAPDTKRKVLQFCVDMGGRRYGRLDIVGIGWVRLSKFLFNKIVKNPFRRHDVSMVCSGLTGWVVNVLEAVGRFDTPDDAGPKWVYNKCVDMHQRGLCERYPRYVE